MSAVRASARDSLVAGLVPLGFDILRKHHLQRDVLIKRQAWAVHVLIRLAKAFLFLFHAV